MKPLILVALLAVPLFADTVPGDCDSDGRITVSDAVCVINYIFAGIEPPRLEWWERDTVSTLLVFDGRTYPMEWFNIEAWTHFVVAGTDTGRVQWIRIGESIKMDSSKFVRVR